jgi:DNA ligase (NAD+)
MKNIIEFLNKAKEAYYEGNPIISDSQYDELESRYLRYTEVGYQIKDGLPHFSQLYSLDKVYTDDLSTKLKNFKDYVVTPKLDGASISLLYVNNEFTQALTRGDGKLGKDVTDLVKDLVPPILYSDGDNTIRQLRGEIVAPKTIENARNYAAGALNLKSKEEFDTRTLFFIAHEVYPNRADTYIADMQMLSDMCFVVGLGNKFEEFPQDGLVYRLNNYKDYYAAGFTAKHPKGAFALKERSEGVKTVLKEVIWQTGKSGKVTPVAILEPVMVGDALVSRATLNNIEFIEALGLELGDEVLIERAGGIIPRIISKVL